MNYLSTITFTAQYDFLNIILHALTLDTDSCDNEYGLLRSLNELSYFNLLPWDSQIHNTRQIESWTHQPSNSI